ncbi:hypothetical protein [Shimia ponticola]|uniref:hypothetical protein n=1 Tax=Shimia ponticola TaxID=2582893 RepID=UPI0011BF6F79|nr:hypothetical protein [Shimia ponticola]
MTASEHQKRHRAAAILDLGIWSRLCYETPIALVAIALAEVGSLDDLISEPGLRWARGIVADTTMHDDATAIAACCVIEAHRPGSTEAARAHDLRHLIVGEHRKLVVPQRPKICEVPE